MKRTLVIAPYSAHRILFKRFRKDDVFSNVKFITREELVANYFYSYNDEAIKYLIKNHHLDYLSARSYLQNIIVLEKEDKLLSKYKEELLSNHLLVSNPLFKYELDNSDIHVFYYSKEDPYLKRALKNCEVTYDELTGELKSEIIEFENAENQLYYIFNEIEKLLSNGVPSSKIFISGLLDEDEVIFNRLIKNYSLNAVNAFPKSIYTFPIVKSIVNSFSGNLDALISSIDTSLPYYDVLTDTLKTYFIEGLDVDTQRRLYKDVLSLKYFKGDRYKEAIKVIDDPIIDDDEYVFIINFAQGVYPKNYRDVDVIDDEAKLKLGIITSKEMNIASNEYYSNMMKQKGNITLCYAKNNFSTKFSPSPIRFVFNQKVSVRKPQLDVYSYEEAKYRLADYLDLKRKYRFYPELTKAYEKAISDIEYQQYDNTFKGVKHFSEASDLEISYSQAKTFYECQYKYYLSRVLKLNEIEPTFNILIGDIMHKVLEHIDTHKDFETLFNEALEVHKAKGEFNEKDKVFIPRLKYELKKAFDLVKEFDDQVYNPSISREKDLGVKLESGLTLVGKIDKVILSGSSQEYVSIIDYKLSTESFSETKVQYGFSLQLPTYAYLFTRKFKDKSLLALAIQPLLSSEALKILFKDEDAYKKNLKIKGIYLKDKEALKSLDSELDSNKRLAGISITKAGEFKSDSKVYSKEQLDEFAKKAEELLLKAGHSIKGNQFKINPKYFSNKNQSCTYCPYNDICFHSLTDVEVLDDDEEDSYGA